MVTSIFCYEPVIVAQHQISNFFQLHHSENKLHSTTWWWCALCTKPRLTMAVAQWRQMPYFWNSKYNLWKQIKYFFFFKICLNSPPPASLYSDPAYVRESINWFFIHVVLAHSNTLSWFWVNQSFSLLLKTGCLWRSS